MAALGGHTNWSQASSMGMRTAMLSRKVITCEIAPLSLLRNTPLGRSSQQSLVQEAASSTPVSSQNTLTSGETPTSCTFPFGHCHCRPHATSPTLCKAWEYTSNHRELSTIPCTSSHIMNCPILRTVSTGRQMSCPWTLILLRQTVRRHLASKRAAPSVPTVSSVMRSYQGTSGPPGGVDCLQHLLSLTYVYLVPSPLPRASSGMLQPPLGRRSAAVILPPHYAVDWHMLSLEIILLCLVLIEQGLGHPLTQVTGPSMGGNVDHRSHFGCGSDVVGCGRTAAAPQRCTGG